MSFWGRAVSIREQASLHSRNQRVIRIDNPRNSCYAISSINLLMSCPPFVTFIQSLEQNGDLVNELRILMDNNDVSNHQLLSSTLNIYCELY